MDKARKTYRILVGKHLGDRRGMRKILRLNIKGTVSENMR
jgi:hypothetical protein